MTILGALFSAAIIVVSRALPGLDIHDWAKRFVDSLDFKSTLLDGMLSFLLFDGAFQIKLADMRDGRWPILALATFGTIFSTLIVAIGLKLLLLATGPNLPFVWCLVFGALISPTDPVAVIAILRMRSCRRRSRPRSRRRACSTTGSAWCSSPSSSPPRPGRAN